MNSFSPLTGAELATALLCLLFFAVALLSIRRELRARAADKAGPFVAEVWLDWPICRGSTMYRARFSTQHRAYLAAKSHAVWLDFLLPSAYRAEYSNGRPYWEPYEFAIRFGVRELTEREKINGVSSMWTATLPGLAGHAGEHREGHPSMGSLDIPVPATFSGGLEGYRV